MEIRRDFYLDKLIKKKNNGLIKVITGIRRCGKSYLLNRLFYHHLLESGVNFAATSPAARGKKSAFTGNEAHAHGHEVHREQRGFCPSAP